MYAESETVARVRNDNRNSIHVKCTNQNYSASQNSKPLSFYKVVWQRDWLCGDNIFSDLSVYCNTS